MNAYECGWLRAYECAWMRLVKGIWMHMNAYECGWLRNTRMGWSHLHSMEKNKDGIHRNWIWLMSHSSPLLTPPAQKTDQFNNTQTEEGGEEKKRSTRWRGIWADTHNWSHMMNNGQLDHLEHTGNAVYGQCCQKSKSWLNAETTHCL